MSNDLANIQKIGEFTADRGYISSAPKEEATSYMAKGSKNALLTGTGKVLNAKGPTVKTGVTGGKVLVNIAEDYGSIGELNEVAFGSLFNVFAALMYIGAGKIKLAGMSLGVQASSTLWILVKKNGSYADPASGPFQAGLAQPSAAIITAVTPPAGFIGKNSGVVSVVIWRIRSSTGAVSVKSLVSNVAGAVNQSISVRFPLPDANGQDYWGIGVTKNGEGSFGSHFHFKEVAETVIAADTNRAFTIEWRDGDLAGQTYAPSRDYPPPAGLFAGTLQDVTFVDGAYGDVVQNVSSVTGSAISVSEPGKPESFAADKAIFTSDTPTALVRGDEVYWRFGRNTLNVIRYLGGDPVLSVEPAWTGMGVLYQSNACVAEGGRLYAFTSGRGLVRMNGMGMPESIFAADVTDDFANLNASEVVLGWHGNLQLFCLCYRQQVWCFNTALSVWCAPIDLSTKITGNIKACVTENNSLIFSTYDGTTDRLYDFETGTGLNAEIMTGWVNASASLDTVADVTVQARTDSLLPVTIEVFADGDDTTPVQTMTVTPRKTGFQTLPTIKPNVTDCEQHALKIIIPGAGGDAGFERALTYGDSHSIQY